MTPSGTGRPAAVPTSSSAGESERRGHLVASPPLGHHSVLACRSRTCRTGDRSVAGERAVGGDSGVAQPSSPVARQVIDGDAGPRVKLEALHLYGRRRGTGSGRDDQDRCLAYRQLGLSHDPAGGVRSGYLGEARCHTSRQTLRSRGVRHGRHGIVRRRPRHQRRHVPGGLIRVVTRRGELLCLAR